MIEERQTPTAAEEARAHLLAKVSNDHLLKVREAVANLATNLDSSFWYAFRDDSAVRINRNGLLAEVKALKDAIEEEYAIRLMRGYRLDLQKMIAGLQPQVAIAIVERGQITPINAAAAEQQQQEEKKQEAVQTMSALVEQFRDALASFNPTNESAASEEEGE